VPRGPIKLGVIPLSDGAGEVAATGGDGVTRVKVGDRIAGCFHPRWFGGPIRAGIPDRPARRQSRRLLAEYAVLSEEALVHVPSHLSLEEGATLPCAAVTAWVRARARALTDGRGVDCVVEIGGPGTLAMSLKVLAVRWHASLIGASLSSSGTGLDPLLLTGRGITLGSISVGTRTDFEAMNRAIEMHRVRPVIDWTFPFAEATEAYWHFEGRGHFGKVVITHR
jgi:NADPH:quinone reductase-like Zn-dependent oxidoreductase